MHMKEINTILVDDNPDSREILTAFISYLPQINLIAELKDGEELLTYITSDAGEDVDLVLADIGMPKINGIEANKLCTKLRPELKFIFITGYEDFAVEAFTLSAIDYIVKPIEQERLYKGLKKAVSLINNEREKSKSISTTDKLIVKKGRTTFYIRLDTIYFIEKRGKDTVVHTKSGVYETLDSLEAIDSSLNDPSFFQTHRSYIVNLNNVLSVEASGKTYLIRFDGYPEVAHISKLKISQFQKMIK